MFLIIVTTVGTPVYESESGPIIGYDGVMKDAEIFHDKATLDEALESLANDPEFIRNVETYEFDQLTVH